MKIADIVLSESYYNELLTAVQDLLVRVIDKGLKEIGTERFKALLAKQGYITTTNELIGAVNDSGFATSVDKNKIVPKSELPTNMKPDGENSVDVSKLAGNQAMQNIKADL
jgi:hypothetical protein